MLWHYCYDVGWFFTASSFLGFQSLVDTVAYFNFVLACCSLICFVLLEKLHYIKIAYYLSCRIYGGLFNLENVFRIFL